jgi:spoIIIJ-associated protein
MIKIEANTLEEAYDKASKELSCSITNLETEVVQYPSSGFLGFFKKSAIIIATCKTEPEKKDSQKEQKPKVEEKTEPKKEKVDKSQPKPEVKKEKPTENSDNNKEQPKKIKKEPTKEEVKKTQNVEQKNTKKVDKPAKKQIKKVDKKSIDKQNSNKPQKTKQTFESSTDNIMTNFYGNNDENSKENIIEDIKVELTRLFSFSCYDINITDVRFHDDRTVYIEFDGPDSALLIGKDGYRYKALSYMIFNWINNKYDLMIRLEISSFLKNQEEMIDKYLETVIAKVNKDGNAKTKPLNGILVYIALSKLRDQFPNKYVSVKDGFDNTKYIIVNEFLNNKRR